MRSTYRRVLPLGRREIVCSRAAAQGNEATDGEDIVPQRMQNWSYLRNRRQRIAFRRNITVLGGVLLQSSAIRSRIPRVRLVPPFPAPGVERVVHHHAVLQHLVVVLEIAGQAE